MSLLECADKNIVNRIRRAIPINILQKIIMETYIIYKKKYNNEYSNSLFNLAEEVIDPFKSPNDFEFIFENGFYSYYLLLTLAEDQKNVKFLDENDENILDILNEFREEKDQENNLFFKNSGLLNFLNYFSSLNLILLLKFIFLYL